MNWEHIEINWEEFKTKAMQQWDRLSAAQLESIAGNRKKLADVIHEAYGISKHAVEWQLSGWEQRQHQRALGA